MKRILIVLLCLVCLCKANAQPNYDVEIDGLCYSLNLNESTAGLVHVQPSVSEVDVPSSIMIGDRSFIVDYIMLDCWNYNLNYDFSYINTIHIPNTVVELRLRFGSENNAVLPTISSLTIPSSIEVVALWGIKGLTSIVIPASVKEVEYISYLPDLLDIIIEDDSSTLKWSTEYWNFKGINTNLNYMYLGRQLTRQGSSYPYSFFGGNCPNNVVIGPNVHDLSGYNLFSQTVVIPNTVKVGILGNNAPNEPMFPNKVVFEDGIDNWRCSSFYNLHTPYGNGIEEISEWYIGRPGVILDGFNARNLTMGPLLKSQQVKDCLNPVGYFLYPCSVKGDSAFVKLYQFLPPEIQEEGVLFDNETYMYTPLYVPIGSKRLYEQAYHWRNFFNIVEFDCESPYISVYAVPNDNTLGRVEGYGEFDVGEMVTLTATSIPGYHFVNWTENEEVVSTDRIYTFEAERNRVLVANFKHGTSVEENEENSFFSVFSNDRVIIVEGADMASDIFVYNVQGQCIYKGKEKKISVPASGLYVVEIGNKKMKIVVD